MDSTSQIRREWSLRTLSSATANCYEKASPLECKNLGCVPVKLAKQLYFKGKWMGFDNDTVRKYRHRLGSVLGSRPFLQSRACPTCFTHFRIYYIKYKIYRVETDVQIEFGVREVFSYSKLIVNSCILDNIVFTTWLYFLVSTTLSLQQMLFWTTNQYQRASRNNAFQTKNSSFLLYNQTTLPVNHD